jgi:hypothetical protein
LDRFGQLFRKPLRTAFNNVDFLGCTTIGVQI